jgi:hypothetical protein
MTVTPILFSAPMVRALLDGRKTMTRRVIKLPTNGEYVRPDMGGWAASTLGGGGCFTISKDGSRIPVAEHPVIWNQTTGTCLSLKYEVGDLLWVRENWAKVPASAFRQSPDVAQTINPQNPYEAVIYAAGWDPSIPKWRPSIHMSRWMSRLTLEVTAVKVERLHDISSDDAENEGVEKITAYGWRNYLGEKDDIFINPVASFASLWESINGEGSWAANPYVVAPVFTVHKCNMSEMT